jgi:hypothetical protein
MASFVKYQQFASDLAGKVHDLLGTGGSTADVLKVMLSNAAPNVATHAVRADVTELSTGAGYTSGGEAATNVGTASGGTVTVVGTDIVFTASGALGPFRYAILYNDTPSSPADPLIGYWDYTSSVTLASGETFTVNFGASLFTIA